MSHKFLQSSKVAATLVGTVVGAGLASGQELMTFFVSQRGNSIYAVWLTAILFCVGFTMVILLTKRWGITSYQGLLQLSLSRNWALVVDLLLLIFLWGGLGIMLAGAGALTQEQLGLPWLIGPLSMMAVCLPGLWAEKDGLLRLNSILVPALLVGLLLISFNGGTGDAEFVDLGRNSWGWVVSAVLYVSYNITLSLGVLAALGGQGDAGTTGGGIIAGLILGTLLLVMVLTLLSTPGSWQQEIPMLYLARQGAPWLVPFYAVNLWIGMATTAAANAFTIAKRITAVTGFSYHFALILAMVISIPLASLGFSRLVGSLYPVMGFIGIPVLIMLGKALLKEWKT